MELSGSTLPAAGFAILFWGYSIAYAVRAADLWIRKPRGRAVRLHGSPFFHQAPLVVMLGPIPAFIVETWTNLGLAEMNQVFLDDEHGLALAVDLILALGGIGATCVGAVFALAGIESSAAWLFGEARRRHDSAGQP
jgi:hypothetical protein